LNHPDTHHSLGWETIWRSSTIPGRYQSFAEPETTVTEWAETLCPGAFILDLGCGIGRHATYLGASGFRMAGLDISPTGIQRAHAACAERGIAFEARVSDMKSIPWPDETFDAALSTATMHHQLRTDEALTVAEVWRVLKPGGSFLVDLPCTLTFDYQLLRDLVNAGQIAEVEPNTFLDQRAQPADIDGYLLHHYSDETDVRDLLGRFELSQLRAAVHARKPEEGGGLTGKWVAWAHKHRKTMPTARVHVI